MTAFSDPLTLTGHALAEQHMQQHAALLASRDYDIRDFGALVAADKVASVQAAINAATSDGGGRIVIPRGSWPLVATNPQSDDSPWGPTHLRVRASNITLAGPGTLVSAVDAIMVGVGAGEGAQYDEIATHPLAGPIAKYAMSLTLSSGASSFAVGDYIFIRTGQTIPGYTSSPDSEINQAASVNTGTGAIGLAWPTTKPYVQEYFVDGTIGVSSAAVTANPCIFGVANITACTITDFTVDGIGLSSQSSSQALVGGQVVRMRLANIRGSFATGLQSMSSYRFGWITGNFLDHPYTGNEQYTLTTAYGASDVDITDNIITGRRVSQLHIHEGSSRINVHGNHFLTATTAADETLIDVRGRAYDISIIGNTLVGGGYDPIFVDELCPGGGVILGNQFLGVGPDQSGMVVRSTGWLIASNRTPFSTPAVYSGYNGGADTDTRTLSAWVTKDIPVITLGTLPGNAYVLGVYVQVDVAFDSDGTDLIAVGSPDTWVDFFGLNTDVHTTGLQPVTSGVGVGWCGYSNRSVVATYSHGGSAPTVGSALVVLSYTLVPAKP